LTAIRAVNWSHQDWQAQASDPGGDQLATRPTWHTLMSGHKGCFGSSTLIFRLSGGLHTKRRPATFLQRSCVAAAHRSRHRLTLISRLQESRHYGSQKAGIM
jgi:hypothetical protein